VQTNGTDVAEFVMKPDLMELLNWLRSWSL
jgi:hypothetical protein